ncbi:MAG: ATP-binding cassette domain-containing protein [Pseudomonadales bacterium]|jgi:cell division transport system ATP-binding protein|nr:ATP-binding cassette domain-containing protein [Pseudomonadales bacterium]
MLVFDKVTKCFNEDCYGLQDVSFTIEPGEFVFLTGHSGSGKTTMLKLLLKEYKLSSGDIVFDDKKIKKLRGNKIAKHRQKIGVVFQDYKLLPEFTVWENIALPLYIAKHKKTEIKERVSDLLNLIDLKGYENHFPSQLSGGQAQRVGIARALATAPQLIFADEPTGNLDNEASENILNLLAKINSYGTTIIFSTHNLSLIEQLDGARLLTLEKGCLIEDTGEECGKEEDGDDEEVEEVEEKKVEEKKVKKVKKKIKKEQEVKVKKKKEKEKEVEVAEDEEEVEIEVKEENLTDENEDESEEK